MGSACTCGHHGPVEIARAAAGSAPAVDPGQTVESLLARAPRTREVLQRFGLNHCCGAHLSLRDSAAAAGADLDRLVAELGTALAADAAGRA